MVAENSAQIAGEIAMAGQDSVGAAEELAATAVAALTAKMLVWSFNELNRRKLNGEGVGKGFVATYGAGVSAVLFPLLARTLARGSLSLCSISAIGALSLYDISL